MNDPCTDAHVIGHREAQEARWAAEHAVWAEVMSSFADHLDARKRVRVLARRGLVEERIFPASAPMRSFALSRKGVAHLFRRSKQTLALIGSLPCPPASSRVAQHLLCVRAGREMSSCVPILPPDAAHLPRPRPAPFL